MNKSVLVIDTPKSCAFCPLLNGSDECSMQDEDANFNADGFAQLVEGCPLKRVPEKKAVCGRMGNKMRYKCIKEMCLPKCDEDGFAIPNEYGFVTVGSMWERDDRASYIGGDVHLGSLNNNPDFGWIEMPLEKLRENFVMVG